MAESEPAPSTRDALVRPPACATTGIGDLPHTDAREAVSAVFDRHPDLPYWPQLPKRSAREGMIGQFLGRFPFLQYRRPTPRLSVEGDSPEMKDVLERIAAGDPEMAPPPLGIAEAGGWHALLERIEGLPAEDRPAVVKGQLTGPVSGTSLACDVRGTSLMQFPGYLTAISTYLGGIGVHQCETLRELGCQPLIVLDEPMLHGVNPEEDEAAIEAMVTTISALLERLRAAGALTAIHCGGAMAWPLYFKLPVDWISFDVPLALESLRGHADSLLAWIAAGRGLSLGVVPTSRFEDDYDPEAEADRIVEQLTAFLGSFTDVRTLLGRAIISAASGTMTQPIEKDERIATAVDQVARRLRESAAD